jgi:hypothetical protein
MHLIQRQSQYLSKVIDITVPNNSAWEPFGGDQASGGERRTVCYR